MNLLKLRDRFRVKRDECRDPINPTPRGGHVYQHGERTVQTGDMVYRIDRAHGLHIS